MKVIFAIEVEDANEVIDKNTSESLKKIDPSYNSFSFTKENFLDESKAITDEYSHVIIIPNGSELNSNYLDIVSVYSKEDAIMLPLTVLKVGTVTGVLNTCLWNTNLSDTIGELDFDLAQKQIDLTLYGAMIPLKHIKTENFNNDIKYYGHFYFLNKVTKNEVPVLGVPKTLLTTNKDLTFASVPNDEKVKYFNMAKEV
jgi:hypothetical protein